jgi:hypothetical protein
MVGVDRAKMRLYDLEASAQVGISDSGQEKYDDSVAVFDRTTAGNRVGLESIKY